MNESICPHKDMDSIKVKEILLVYTTPRMYQDFVDNFNQGGYAKWGAKGHFRVFGLLADTKEDAFRIAGMTFQHIIFESIPDIPEDIMQYIMARKRPAHE